MRPTLPSARLATLLHPPAPRLAGKCSQATTLHLCPPVPGDKLDWEAGVFLTNVPHLLSGEKAGQGRLGGVLCCLHPSVLLRFFQKPVSLL